MISDWASKKKFHANAKNENVTCNVLSVISGILLSKVHKMVNIIEKLMIVPILLVHTHDANLASKQFVFSCHHP